MSEGASADAPLWAERDPRLDAFCVTAVEGVRLGDVVLRFDGEPASEERATVGESFNGYPDPTYIVVDEVPGGVLVFESNGWRGVQQGVPERVSRGGRCVCLYRSVNADMTFVLAENGRLLASFDPLLEPVPEQLAGPAAGFDFEGYPTSSSLGLLARISGITLDETWLDGAHRRYRVPSPH